MLTKTGGFTLIEMIAVIVIVGVLAATSRGLFIPSKTLQLQSSRDSVVAAFSSAQQRAMSQTDSVRVITSANAIDIRQDIDNNGSFAVGESIFVGGVQYPISLPANQTLASSSFDFDRLGRTGAQTITLAQGGNSVTITVSSTGYVY